jgi:hypothetical protein
MKEVILKEPHERLQTLRKALRIEDYKVAVDNTSTLLRRLKEKTKYLEGATQDIDMIKKKIDDETTFIRQQKHPKRSLETEPNSPEIRSKPSVSVTFMMPVTDAELARFFGIFVLRNEHFA